MTKNIDRVSLKKSKRTTEGLPNLPLPEQLVEGELAINYAKDVETISLKNESGTVVTFSSDNYYTEKKLGSGFTGDNSAKTVTDYITELEGENLWEAGTGLNAVVLKNSSGTASGDFSVAEGKKTIASGDYAVAEGNSTVASGSSSHAEGGGAQANGIYSHAEGGGTQANGSSSHAEGGGTKANGSSSHAEGGYTTASGDMSHAEGGGTQASGEQSHAEGSGTIANGKYSHAEGTNTTASGSSSHAEGSSTKASGNYSHAEGTSTTASSESSHAEGGYTTASGNYSHAEGYQTSAMTNYSHAEGYNAKANGIYSHAEGNSTTASGNSSHAEGYNTQANGTYSHAEGQYTIANGSHSHAEGTGTTANGNYSHAEGQYTNAKGQSSHAEGGGTQASGTSSHAEGSGTKANGNYSHAEGGSTIASGTSSHAEGSGTQANGAQSHAEGYSTIANNDSEHASGQYNISNSATTIFGDSGNTLFSVGNGTANNARHNAFEIRQNGDIYVNDGTNDVRLQDYLVTPVELWVSGTGVNSIVQKGSNGIASGSYTVVEGYQTSALTNYSHAEGQSTIANAYGSHTEGYNTQANGQFSHAEGQNTIAGKDGYMYGQCHAEGTYTEALGDSSHAEGNGTKALGKNSHAEGESTKALDRASHAEGENTEAYGRASHTEGLETIASGHSSHAEGYQTDANGGYSHAEGNSTQADGEASHAEGQATLASGNYSHAEGYWTSGTGVASHAEGGSTQANGNGSHAEGWGTITNNISEHASGQFNVSSKDDEGEVMVFGSSGSTLFSVGNGTADDNRHNAFEIRQNGDIYIVSGNSDIRLQDYIGGGGSITVDQVLDDTTSASTNPVSSKAVYKAVTDNELVWTNAFVVISGAISSHTEDTSIHVTSADKAGWDAKLDASAYTPTDLSDYYTKSETSGATELETAFDAIDDKFGSGFTVSSVTEVIESNERVIASSLNDLNTRKLDASAYTPTDLSNYYTKAEVDIRDLWVSGTGLNAIVQKGTSGVASGDYAITEGYQTSALTSYSHAEGSSTIASGQSSHAEGYNAVAIGQYSHAEGYSHAIGIASHAEGGGAAFGNGSHAEGTSAASGETSHAEGYQTIANGDYSHTEGNETQANGLGSHAEGAGTQASGSYSHAEGSSTKANGGASHAEGISTVTNNQGEHASGNYNISLSASVVDYEEIFGESGSTLFSVGNGAYINHTEYRHNAIEIKENGDIYIANTNSTASANYYEKPMIKLQDAIDLTNYYTKSETSGATEISTALSGKSDTGHTHDDRYYTEAEIDILVGSGFTSSSITDVIIENEQIVSSSLNDLDERKLDASAYTPTDLSDYYTKSETSGATELETAFNGKTDTATTTALNNVVTAHTADSTSHLTSTEKSQLHTHSNKTYLDGITGSVGTMAYENASSYSSATQVSTALADKVDKTEYATFSAATNTSIKDLSGQSETVAAALNDLNAKKLDTTAYTPTDLSNYYTKGETSGATEIQTALNGKVDITAFTSHTSSSVHMTTTEKTNLDSLATNIAAISGITATKVSNWDDANTKKHTHSNKTALDSITGNVGTMAYEDKTSYSSATEVNTALSNYYTKSETSGATEISDALNGKVDTNTFDTIVGSGYTNTTITEVIENMDTAIAAALTDLYDKIGDIESILATI